MPTTLSELALQRLSFSELGALLQSDDAEGALKQVFLGALDTERPNVNKVLSLSSAKELAGVLSILVAQTPLDNQKSGFKALSTRYQGAELTEAYNSFEAELPLQSLQRAADGSLKIDKESGLPIAVRSPSKIGKLFTSVESALLVAASVNWSDAENLSVLKQVAATRMSHPVRLSGGKGGGGFLKTTSVSTVDNPASVSEEDFLTRDTQTMSGGSAALQNRWPLILPLVEFEGTEYRLPDLFAMRPDIATHVTQILVQAGGSGVEAFMEAYKPLSTTPPVGESQVFVGASPSIKTLSVLTPFSLPHEVMRAKRSLGEYFAAEKAETVKSLAAELDALVAQQAAVPPLVKTAAKEAKDERALVLSSLKAQIVGKKEAIKAAEKSFLSVASMPLLYGGANPRNLAANLNSSLHNANILTQIKNRKPAHALSPKTFYSSALVALVKVETSKLPSFLRATAAGASAKCLRTAFFADIMLRVLEPLTTLQALYAQNKTDGADALHAAAMQVVTGSSEPWALFVKGDATLNGAQAMQCLHPLVSKLQEAVKGSLTNAFGADFSNEFDNEIHALVTHTVKLERA